MVPDFPFYNGTPVALRASQWICLLLAVAAGFAALHIPDPWALSGFVPAMLFAAIPLAALRGVAGPHWRALFQRVGWKDVALALCIALVNIGVTVSIALVVARFSEASANPAAQALADSAGVDRLLFFLMTLPQLLGEEVLTMVPFLAVLTLFYQVGRLSRGAAIVGAWIVSAALFGMVHLPTYDWNWVQCLVIIGSARLVLSLGYLATRNLWVSTMAHVINDWILFGLVLALPALKAVP